MSTKSDSFLQKVENGHSVHWIQKPSLLAVYSKKSIKGVVYFQYLNIYFMPKSLC